VQIKPTGTLAYCGNPEKTWKFSRNLENQNMEMVQISMAAEQLLYLGFYLGGG
jgi:hypothetical protein